MAVQLPYYSTFSKIFIATQIVLVTNLKLFTKIKIWQVILHAITSKLICKLYGFTEPTNFVLYLFYSLQRLFPTWNRQDAKRLLSGTRKHRRNPRVPDANEPEASGEQMYKHMQMLKSFLLRLRWREFTWIL